MENKKTGIIGIGNMGSAIALGLLKSGFVPADKIFVSDRREGTLKELRGKGINTSMDNRSTAKNADVIIVAVKPYHIEGVINEIKQELPSMESLTGALQAESIEGN